MGYQFSTFLLIVNSLKKIVFFQQFGLTLPFPRSRGSHETLIKVTVLPRESLEVGEGVPVIHNLVFNQFDFSKLFTINTFSEHCHFPER